MGVAEIFLRVECKLGLKRLPSEVLLKLSSSADGYWRLLQRVHSLRI